jgi:hypothetical protein
MNAVTALADEPDHAGDILEDVRAEISANDDDLRDARDRLKVVLDAAATFDGTVKRPTFRSGSLAHRTVNNPVQDGDGGVVLDRRTHPTLGPDSTDKTGPDEIMRRMRDHVMPLVRKKYPKATGKVEGRKRSILIEFHEPLRGTENDKYPVDPTVDLIVGLTRKDAPGIWIPNRTSKSWDPSDPQRHTELLTAGPTNIRHARSRVLRLAKSAVKQDGKSAVMVSFNVEALGLQLITRDEPLIVALQRFFDDASKKIRGGLTDDPAGVSGKIRLPAGIDRDRAARRLAFFATSVQAAIDAPDRATAKAELAKVFPDQLGDADKSAKAQAAKAIRERTPSKIAPVLGLSPAVAIPSTPSYGDGNERSA